LLVPTAWFGYCFAFGVSGYLAGTVVCRRLLPRLGTVRTFHIGTGLSMFAGVVFLIGVAAGIVHWWLVLAAMFLTMLAHGLNFPIGQSGSVSPFPKQAGTAAGLMGALSMLVAFIVGSVVGATHNGTLYPLALIACTLGVLIFLSARLFSDLRTEAA
jgi:DHA1 family bicyclomycin/chloramphenicol resistance-like MFS transporter